MPRPPADPSACAPTSRRSKSPARRTRSSSSSSMAQTGGVSTLSSASFLLSSAWSARSRRCAYPCAPTSPRIRLDGVYISVVTVRRSLLHLAPYRQSLTLSHAAVPPPRRDAVDLRADALDHLLPLPSCVLSLYLSSARPRSTRADLARPVRPQASTTTASPSRSSRPTRRAKSCASSTRHCASRA